MEQGRLEGKIMQKRSGRGITYSIPIGDHHMRIETLSFLISYKARYMKEATNKVIVRSTSTNLLSSNTYIFVSLLSDRSLVLRIEDKKVHMAGLNRVGK